MTRHADWARWLAVSLWWRVVNRGLSEDEAVEQFHELYNDIAEAEGLADSVTEIKDFLQRHYNHWRSTGNVEDMPRSGRPPKISDAEAADMARIFKGGMIVTVVGDDGQSVPVGHRYYTGIKDAIAYNPQIAQFVHDKDITPQTLLERMLRADDQLVVKSLDVKPAFTADQMKERVWVARQLLRSSQDELSWVVWVDCGSIVLYRQTTSCSVYMSTEDPAYTEVMPQLPGGRQKPIVLSFFMAVNALLGPVYLEFVTGTTELRRADTFRPVEKREHHYMVSTIPSKSEGGSAMDSPTWSASASKYDTSCPLSFMRNKSSNVLLNTSSGVLCCLVSTSCMTRFIRSKQASGSACKSA
jgi:hypothetical protein